MSVRSLGLLALVLLLLFVLQLSVLLFPFLPLDPGWQWRLSSAVINAAFLPLLALALLQIGVALDPADALLQGRQRLCRQLAVPVAFAFLLLLPLQLSAGLRLQSSVGTAQQQRIVAAEQRLAALRQATAVASSNAELNTSLQKLNGPVLGPADLANPLPLLKAQVNAVFDQAQAQINRDRAALPPASASARAALPELLRNGLACLLLATGFAAFARRSRSELSLLQETQEQLRRLRRGFSLRLPGRGVKGRSEADYIREMTADREG